MRQRASSWQWTRENNGLQPRGLRCWAATDGPSVGRRRRDEGGSTDLGCDVALDESLVEVLLDGGDTPFLGGVGAQGWSKWLVHLL